MFAKFFSKRLPSAREMAFAAPPGLLVENFNPTAWSLPYMMCRCIFSWMQITEANLETVFGIRDLWRLHLQAEVWGGYLQNPYTGGMLSDSCLPSDLSGPLRDLGVRALFPKSKSRMLSLLLQLSWENYSGPHSVSATGTSSRLR